MSQHIYETTFRGRPIEVTLGWDRPLRGFYMYILYADCDNEEEFLFSNLKQAVAFPPSLDPYKSTLICLGITLPESMFAQAAADQRRDVVNRVCLHSADGWNEIDGGNARTTE